MMRDGLTADPSTWVGNTSTVGNRRSAVVVCYRGAAPTTSQLAVCASRVSCISSSVVW